ncbi:hypothetical protein PC116_g18992 [Phytophthora cactorum]|nr:hypothetical protein PC116_g18992 [Phytophthora cactorum]
MVLEAAIDRICNDAKGRTEDGKITTFTAHLVDMDNDDQRITWLKGRGTVANTTDKIVGVVWVSENHWCALCICLTKWTYIVMDPRNDEATIVKVDTLFRKVFHPY